MACLWLTCYVHVYDTTVLYSRCIPELYHEAFTLLRPGACFDRIYRKEDEFGRGKVVLILFRILFFIERLRHVCVFLRLWRLSC
jgi:hypothetical protein